MHRFGLRNRELPIGAILIGAGRWGNSGFALVAALNTFSGSPARI